MADQVEVKTQEEKPARRIVVAHGFTLTDSKNQRVRFEPGVHENVPAEYADHWYTKAHLSKDGKVPFSAGGQANDDAEKRQLNARILELQTQLTAAGEAASRVQVESSALKARAEGAERGAEDLLAQNTALRERAEAAERGAAEVDPLKKRVSDLEADNAALQVKADAAGKKTGAGK